MENSPTPETNQTPGAPVQAVPGKKSFLKKMADKLPGWMFPKLNPKSAHTASIIGLVVSAFALLLSLVPCVGGNAWLFAIPALYVCLMAIRFTPSDESTTLATVGTILSLIALVVALYWIAFVNAAADAAAEASRDFERSFGSGDFSF
ncbi:MAG: hypothetical protein IJT88_07755 [Kiritimatiellae bacterium]|nr:hypothetical protein [Kiritimatiellia bacterium]